MNLVGCRTRATTPPDAAARRREGSMFNKRTELVRRGEWLDPFAVFTRLAPEFAEFFGDTAWPTFRTRARTEATPWSPNIDVFEREDRLIARVDLPGTKKEEVKVEVVDGRLSIFGERKREIDEEKENFYRREREYGTFYRALPLPEGAKVEDVKAVFDNGVLEVTVPLLAHTEVTPRAVAIEEPAKAPVKTKAA
jgi:HSP20 family protein